MQDSTEQHQPRPGSLTFYVRLLRWRRLILTNTLIVAVLAVCISLLLPNWYAASVSVLPPQEDVISIAGLTNAMGGALGAAGQAVRALGSGMDLPFMSSKSDYLAGLLRSRRLREKLVIEHNLTEEYKCDNLDQTLLSFADNITIRVGREGILRLTIMDKDPQRAADMTATALRILDEIQRDTHRSRASAVRQFIDSRLETTKLELAAAEESLQVFQEQYGLLVPEEQAGALVKTVAQVEAERLAALIQVNALSSQIGADHPDAQRARALLLSIEEVKAGLEGRSPTGLHLPDNDGTGFNAAANKTDAGNTTMGATVIIDLARLPELSFVYLRLYREMKIRTALFKLLTELLEQYRIQEVRDLPTIQVLDPPTVPVEKARPYRAIICCVATLLGFFISMGLATFLEWTVVLSETDPRRHAQILALFSGVGLGFLVKRH